MKRPAFILLFPFVLFMAETASFIPAMQEACKITANSKNTCSKKQEENTCNTKKAENTCRKTMHEDKSADKKDAKKAPAGKDCENSKTCTSCPVCYTFIFQQQYEFGPAPVYFTKNYGALQANYSSVYVTSVWKPPNGYMKFS
jgi:hypothetical protein